MEDAKNSPDVPDSSVAKTPFETLPEELGQPIRTFYPDRKNLVAGYILAGLASMASVTGLVFLVRHVIKVEAEMPFMLADKNDKEGLSWFLVGLCVLACLAGFLGTYGLLLYVRILATYKICVCNNGLLYTLDGASLVILWDQIEFVREHVQQNYFPLKGPAKNALPMWTSSSFTIRRKDGRQASVDGDAIKDLERFAQILREQSAKRGFPWNVD